MNKLESSAKNYKDLANAAKTSGDDVLRREAQEKINLITSKYYKISQASGLPTRAERMQVAGFRKVKADKILTTAYERDIIKSNEKLLRIPEVPSSDISQKIKTGEYSSKLSRQNYLKHIQGTSQFKQYEADRILRGDNPQSILSITEEEAQHIILEKSGTGIVDVTRSGKPRNVEYISLEKDIGFYFGGGKYHKTKKAAIHYGKKHSHLVPVKGDFYD